MKRILALLLVLPLLAPAQTIPERAVAIPIGSVIDVKLLNQSRLRGQLVTVGESSLTIRLAEGGGIQERAIPFSEVRALTARKSGHTALKIWAGVGIALVSLMVIGAIALGR